MPDKSDMHKIGVIGDKDSVLGFMAVGFAVRIADNETQAATELHRLAADNYAVIYITERLAEKIEADILKYRNVPLPAIITIPGRDGKTGYGIASIKKSVEHAVGADIIFKE
jgi:V/A-type H+-transporting ATPase subunit F